MVRSGYVESVHRGSVLALAPDGSTLFSLGDVDRPVFPRSSNKPLQAVGLLTAGWQPPDEEQLAIAAASHSGEAQHLVVVRRVLASAGLAESALQCPAMLPLNEAAADALLASGERGSRLTMNCSGKHASMLASAAMNGWSTSDYLDPAHPVQRAVRTAIEELAGEPVRHLAVDGCGAPQHALSLRGVAKGFGRVVLTQPRVTAAMRTFPELVGGTGRDVTALMRGVPGLLAKDGAEGVYAAALPDGSAVALKVEDGAARARMPILAAALRRLGCDQPILEELATLPVLGGPRVVGSVRVAAVLR